MMFLRLLLLPFSFLYGVIILLRNFFYDKKILGSEKFPVPVIAVGNLTVGGTGKTPHIEYLIRLLKNDFRIAAVSRGYGRRTSGIIIAGESSTSEIIGDEPMQYHSKFPSVKVMVAEKRVQAIHELIHTPGGLPPQIILLDDAFQHRSVKPHVSLLLMEFDTAFKKNYLLPAGTLREFPSAKKRADAIIITKCPEILVPIERKRILVQLKAEQEQPVFFSFISYGDFIPLSGKKSPMLISKKYYFEKRFTILLLTGIANPAPMIDHLREMKDKIVPLHFRDHHRYTTSDIQRVRELFDSIASPNKIILTTEKDAMRLRESDLTDALNGLPVFYIPIEIKFHHQDTESFNKLILDHVKANSIHGSIHPQAN